MAHTIFACFAHPDDELGCLGTLANHVCQGDRVILAWTTSGEMSSYFNGMSFSEIKKIREEQGKTVGDIIGTETLFLGYGDTSVIPIRDNALKMAKTIAKIKPDAVITWGLNNRHPDHRGTAQILYDALTYARLPRLVGPETPHRPPFHIPMFLYPEQTISLPTVYVDIADTFSKVQKAFELYADFYGWQTKDWLEIRRRNDGITCGTRYAERFQLLSRYFPARKLLPLNNKT
ncbi:MAG: PIG-L deacetylase family protein [Candidatus Heimdallarchaeaceae archaeon]